MQTVKPVMMATMLASLLALMPISSFAQIDVSGVKGYTAAELGNTRLVERGLANRRIELVNGQHYTAERLGAVGQYYRSEDFIKNGYAVVAENDLVAVLAGLNRAGAEPVNGEIKWFPDTKGAVLYLFNLPPDLMTGEGRVVPLKAFEGLHPEDFKIWQLYFTPPQNQNKDSPLWIYQGCPTCLEG